MPREVMIAEIHENQDMQPAGAVGRHSEKIFFKPGRYFCRCVSSVTMAALGVLFLISLSATALAQNEASSGAAEDEPQGAFIGKNEDGDSIMRTAPRPRGEYRSYGDYYQDGIIIAPEVRPIIPLPPGPGYPHNPYPGPGPNPGPRPRDGANQLHQYNYNPQYPQEVPRRSGGGSGRGGSGGLY